MRREKSGACSASCATALMVAASLEFLEGQTPEEVGDSPLGLHQPSDAVDAKAVRPALEVALLDLVGPEVLDAGKAGRSQISGERRRSEVAQPRLATRGDHPGRVVVRPAVALAHG